MIKLIILGNAALYDRPEFIDIFYIDYHVNASVECGHIIHRSETISYQNNKDISPDTDGKMVEILKDDIIRGIVRFVIFIDRNNLIYMKSHGFECVPG